MIFMESITIYDCIRKMFRVVDGWVSSERRELEGRRLESQI